MVHARPREGARVRFLRGIRSRLAILLTLTALPVLLLGGLASYRVDRGNTFWIELARTESPAQRESKVMPGLADLPAPPTVGTVLYVEDNLSNLKLVENLLSHRPGVKVIPAMPGA